MQINITVNLTREEVLAAVTEYIRNQQRFDHRFPFGWALNIDDVGTGGGGDGFFVEWGEKPEKPEPVARVPAVEAGDAPTELEQIGITKEHRVVMAAAL